MDMRGHHFVETEQGLSCAHCHRLWSRVRRSRRWCPGVPWYTCGKAPDELLTFTQLKKKGLAPHNRKEPDGCIVTTYHHHLVYLYDSQQARTRRPETEHQRVARLAVWPRIQAKYTCELCGYVPQNLNAIRYEVYRAGVCNTCQDQLKWEVQEEQLQHKIEQDWRDACAWAHALLQRSDWALIDTETTSLTGRVCEIGIIGSDGSVLFESLVNPECPVSTGAHAKHGISDEVLVTAPTLPQIWVQIQETLQDRTILVAYNAEFDRARLEQSAGHYDLPLLSHEWQCAMERYAAYCGNWSKHHHSYTWVPLDGEHRAIGDARAALACLHEMATTFTNEIDTTLEG